MKRSMALKMKKCLLGGALLAGGLLLTGCGEEPYELQEDERAIIVNYAAHIVAKYNTKQPEGYRYVYVSEEEDAEAAETAKEEQQNDQTNPQDAAADDQGTQEGAQGEQTEDPNVETVQSQTDEKANEEVDGSGQGDATDGDAPEEEPAVTLSEALGLKHVQAVYTGAELTDQYNTVVPSEGKKLLVLHVTLQNPTNKDRSCDILSTFPTFRVKVNGMQTAAAELTILPENLGTWEEKIPAEGSADTVILFQVKEDEVSAVEQLELDVTIGEQTSRVVFL